MSSQRRPKPSPKRTGKNDGKSESNNGTKWLGETAGPPACVIIYDNKIALFSLSKENNLTNVLIEDPALAQIQKSAFKKLWRTIK